MPTKAVFFGRNNHAVKVSTVRAGNVIGGGDFLNDRIILEMAEIVVRNPYSTRLYQHVLEPLFAYLMVAKAQYEDSSFAGYYNVGPDDCDCVTTGELVDLFCEKWNVSGTVGSNADVSGKVMRGFPHAGWRSMAEQGAPHEADFLKLDTSKLKRTFRWKPRWHVEQAVEQTVRFSKIWAEMY